MSLSLFPQDFIQGKRLAYSKYAQKELDSFSFNLPKDYLFFPFLRFKNLTQVLEQRHTLPRAIIVDLDLFSLDHLRSVLQVLREKPAFLAIPIIGLATNKLIIAPSTLAEIGIDDCFYGKIDWIQIENRVRFLEEYKRESIALADLGKTKPYKISNGKRVFDIVFASITLILLSPLFLLIAILIKLESKGPVFYTSKRIGTGYKLFDFIKFRSMQVHADSALKKLSHLNTYKTNGSGEDTFYKIKDDPRVTRIGKIIRKTSLDELPQLINVIKGDMSIIGNRPLPLYEAEKVTKDDWVRRFLAPAGMTGLWQVDKRGKDNLNTAQRIQLDVIYATRTSLLMDVKILLQTLPAMWQKS